MENLINPLAVSFKEALETNNKQGINPITTFVAYASPSSTILEKASILAFLETQEGEKWKSAVNDFSKVAQENGLDYVLGKGLEEARNAKNLAVEINLVGVLISPEKLSTLSVLSKVSENREEAQMRVMNSFAEKQENLAILSRINNTPTEALTPEQRKTAGLDDLKKSVGTEVEISVGQKR